MPDFLIEYKGDLSTEKEFQKEKKELLDLK